MCFLPTPSVTVGTTMIRPSGLYYLNSRYYDPETGRFLNEDLVSYLEPETIGGINLYAYCLNDPVNNIDPSGHLVLSLILAIEWQPGLEPQLVLPVHLSETWSVLRLRENGLGLRGKRIWGMPLAVPLAVLYQWLLHHS